MSIPGPTVVLGNVPGPSLTRSTPPGFSVATLPPGIVPVAPEFITVSFDGSGVFTADVVAGDSAFADFTSGADLGVVVVEHDSRLVGLSAAGVLDLDVVEVEVVAVEFDASGVLDVRVFDGANVVDVDVSFTGEAVTGFGVVEVETADVVFDGAGVVDVGVVPQFDAVMAAAGGANLTIQSIEVEISPANYESMGTLSFDVETVYVVPMEFTGAGILSVDSVITYFNRQKMNKTDLYRTGNGRAIVPGWSADVTYPGTVSSNKLVVSATQSTSVVIHAIVEGAMIGSPQSNSSVYLVHNGTTIASHAQSENTAWVQQEWNVPVTINDGDTVWLEANGGFFRTLRIDVGTFIEVMLP